MSISQKLLVLCAIVPAALLGSLWLAGAHTLELAVGATVSLGGFAAVAWAARSMISARIENLVRVANQLRKGDFAARSNDRGSDELGTLGGSVDAMASEIQRLLQETDQRREYAERVIAAMPVGLVVVDAELKILSINPWCLTRCHLTDESAVIGAELGEALAMPELREEMRRVLETGVARLGMSAEVRFPCSVERSPVLLTIVLVGEPQSAAERRLLVLIEEKFGERALRASEESFRVLIERSPDIVAIHRQGKLIYINPSGIETLGYDRADELEGRPIFELVAPQDRELVAARVKQMMESNRAAPAREEHFVRKDGSIVAAEVMAAPITFQGEKAFAVLARDVTARRQMIARMMQIDRMASAGSLAAGVGHEINNPLAYVISNLDESIERVRKRADPSLHGVDELLSEAREGAERVRKIVASLQSFSRTDDAIELVQVERAADFAIAVCAADVRHRAQLIKDYAVTPPVRASEATLSQVILNVLMNAAQAIPVGQAETNQIRLRTRVEGPNVVLEVSDTGPGMAPEVLSRVFEPFFTTKPIGQGTGLGLSIVHSNVTSMGGEVTIDSAVGVGTTVRISVSAAVLEPSVAAAPPPALETAAPARRASVLVIDDEQRLAKAIVRTLSEDFDAEFVTSGYTALEMLRSGRKFDVIVCDLMMPDLTGMDFHAELLRSDPEQAGRTVFLTGGAFTESARTFVAERPDRWLEKPFEPSALISMVTRFAR